MTSEMVSRKTFKKRDVTNQDVERQEAEKNRTR